MSTSLAVKERVLVVAGREFARLPDEIQKETHNFYPWTLQLAIASQRIPIGITTVAIYHGGGIVHQVISRVEALAKACNPPVKVVLFKEEQLDEMGRALGEIRDGTYQFPTNGAGKEDKGNTDNKPKVTTLVIGAPQEQFTPAIRAFCDQDIVQLLTIAVAMETTELPAGLETIACFSNNADLGAWLAQLTEGKSIPIAQFITLRQFAEGFSISTDGLPEEIQTTEWPGWKSFMETHFAIASGNNQKEKAISLAEIAKRLHGKNLKIPSVQVEVSKFQRQGTESHVPPATDQQKKKWPGDRAFVEAQLKHLQLKGTPSQIAQILTGIALTTYGHTVSAADLEPLIIELSESAASLPKAPAAANPAIPDTIGPQIQTLTTQTASILGILEGALRNARQLEISLRSEIRELNERIQEQAAEIRRLQGVERRFDVLREGIENNHTLLRAKL